MSNHAFYGLAINGYWAPFLRLTCGNCGLKVPARAALQLEGLPCR